MIECASDDFYHRDVLYRRDVLHRRGGCSSMAERRTVDAVVEGSSPFTHPFYFELRINSPFQLILRFQTYPFLCYSSNTHTR